MAYIGWVKNNIGLLGGLMLTAGLCLGNALISIGVILIALQVVMVPPKALTGQLIKKYSPFLAIILLYFWHVFSGIYTEDLHEWGNHLRRKLPFLLLPVAFLSPAMQRKSVYELSHIVFIGAVGFVGLWTGIDYFINYETVQEELMETGAIMIFGGVNHIYYSLFLAYAIIAGGYFAINSKNSALKYSIVGLTLINIVLLHFIGARTGVVAFYLTLFIVMAYYFVCFRGEVLKGIIVLAVLVGSVILSVSFIGPLNQKFDDTLKDFNVILEDKNPNHWSLAQRKESYIKGWQLFKENPFFGVGRGDLGSAMEKQYEKNGTLLIPENRLNPHNQYLLYLAALGLPAFILLLYVLFYPLFNEYYRKDLLFLSFIILAAFAMLPEYILERQIGISFFLYFYCLIYVSLTQKELNTSESYMKKI